MIRLLVVMMVLLAGCANKAPKPAPVPELKKLTVAEQAAEARYRADVHAELAANYYTRQQYDIALEELTIALASDPKHVSAYNLLGLTYMELQQDRKAEEAFATALRLAPDNPDVNNNYGWYLCNRERQKESIPFFLTAVRDTLYKQPHKPLTNAGICSRRAGNQPQAEEYFRRALRLAPADPQINLQLADLNFSRNNFPQAKLHLTRVIEAQISTAEVLWLAVRLDRKMGDRNSEASNALKLKRRFPESREAKLLQSGKYD
ncbi:MAG: type IV pilus biogenesis/stability protein PilW [Burkholderiales bacterium]